MNVTSRVGLLAGAAALTLTGVSVAANPSGTQDNEARIADLEAEVARLRGDGWMNDQRADEIREIVQDVLADASTRTSLLQGNSGGYDGGFHFGNENFALKLNGQLQFRYVLNANDADPSDTRDSTRWGFENRRTKLSFSGHVVDPSWKYKIQGAFDRSGGDFMLEDAYVHKKMDNGTFLRVGQFKGPWMREELVSSKHQLLVERSLVNERFNQGYMQGVSFGWSNDQWSASGMWSNGRDNRNSSALDEDVEFAFMGRVEWLGAGTWGQFKDFTSTRGSEYGVMVGGGLHYERAEFGTASTADQTDLFGMTIDVSVEGDGWNFFGAFVWDSVDVSGGSDRDELGIVAQGGYYFTDDLEGFLRYEWGDVDMPSVSDDLNVLTVGVNKYFSGHQLKWTTDIGVGFDPVTSDWATSGAGYTADEPTSNQDGQVVIRTQMQLLF